MHNEFNSLVTSKRDGIFTISLNRPESLNAFNAELHSELPKAIALAAGDPDTNVVLLTGNGRAFSAGGDIDWQMAASNDPSMFTITVREAREIIYGIIDCEKPMIAKINGPAVGLGATIALFCDVIFGAKSSYISDPHVSVGMVAGDGGSVIWPQLVGFARAKQYLFTGDRISMVEAERIGLINAAVEDAQLDGVVDKFAARLVSGPQAAIRYTKVTINVALRQLVSAALDVGLGYESVTNLTADHKEALTAFREKRAPRFGSSRF